MGPASPNDDGVDPLINTSLQRGVSNGFGFKTVSTVFFPMIASAWKTVKTVLIVAGLALTPLKRGVNEGSSVTSFGNVLEFP